MICINCKGEKRPGDFRTRSSKGSVYRRKVCKECERADSRRRHRDRKGKPLNVETVRGEFTYRKQRRGKGAQKWASDLWEGWMRAEDIAKLPWCPLEVSAVRRRLEHGQSLTRKYLNKNSHEYVGYAMPQGTQERCKLLAFPPPKYRPQPSFGVWHD